MPWGRKKHLEPDRVEILLADEGGSFRRYGKFAQEPLVPWLNYWLEGMKMVNPSVENAVERKREITSE